MEFKEYLTEASLGRMLQHMDKGTPFAVVTASRGENTPAENNTGNKKVRWFASGAGFGHIKVKGSYVEEDGTLVSDDSTIIFGTPETEDDLRKLAISIGKKFKQDSILFRKTNGPVTLIVTGKDSTFGSTGSEHVIGKFVPAKIGDYFSVLKGRPFTFVNTSELVKESVGSMNEGLLWNNIKSLMKTSDSPFEDFYKD